MIKRILNWLDKLSEHFKMDDQLLKNGVANAFDECRLPDDAMEVIVVIEHNGVVWNSVSFIHDPSMKTYEQISLELSAKISAAAIKLSAPFAPDVNDRWSTKYGNKK